jgi:hypothetical protein
LATYFRTEEEVVKMAQRRSPMEAGRICGYVGYKVKYPPGSTAHSGEYSPDFLILLYKLPVTNFSEVDN